MLQYSPLFKNIWKITKITFENLQVIYLPGIPSHPPGSVQRVLRLPGRAGQSAAAAGCHPGTHAPALLLHRQQAGPGLPEEQGQNMFAFFIVLFKDFFYYTFLSQKNLCFCVFFLLCFFDVVFEGPWLPNKQGGLFVNYNNNTSIAHRIENPLWRTSERFVKNVSWINGNKQLHDLVHFLVNNLVRIIRIL